MSWYIHGWNGSQTLKFNRVDERCRYCVKYQPALFEVIGTVVVSPCFSLRD